MRQSKARLLLPDFSSSMTKSPIFPDLGAKRFMVAPESVGLDAADSLAQQLHCARADGYAEGIEALSARLADHDLAAQSRMTEVRAAWITEEGNRLASCLETALEALEQRLSEHMALLLSPFLHAAMKDKMLDNFVATLKRLLDGDGVGFEVSGPADLNAALERALGKRAVGVRWHQTDGCDLHVRLDDTKLRTRSAEWLEGLSSEAQS